MAWGNPSENRPAGVPEFRLDRKPELAEALGDAWRWSEFDQRDGLPSNEVLQVVETKSGQIWASTTGGVAWYDGYSWKQVRCSHSMPVVQIQPLGADRIVANGEGGALVYGTQGCTYVNAKYRGTSLSVLQAVGLEDGRLLILDNDMSVYLWSGKAEDKETIRISGPRQIAGRLNYPQGVPALVASMDGLHRITLQGLPTQMAAATLKDPTQISGVYLRASAETANGQGVVSFAYPQEWAGVWEWDAQAGMRLLPETKGQISRLLGISPTGQILTVYNSAEAWLREGGKWQRINPFPAPLRAASTIYFDSRDRMWVTTGAGLHVLRYGKSFWSPLQVKSPSMHNHVLSLWPTKNGALWAGTAAGLLRMDADGKVTSYESTGSVTLGLVTGLVEDNEGGVWCSSGASFKGVWRMKDGKWTHFGVKEGLADHYFHRLYLDPKGKVWVTSSGAGRLSMPGGVYQYDGQRFVRWDTEHPSLQSRVYSMVITPQGDHWFATMAGVSRYRAGQWRHWEMRDGLKSRASFYLTPRQEGGVYFVDRHSGVGSIDREGVVRYEAPAKTTNALSGWELVEDGQGSLWVATRGGLFLKRKGDWVGLGASTGLANPELWPIALWRGHVCTGTDGSGLYCLDTKALNRPTPMLRVEPVMIDGSVATVSWQVAGYDESSRREGNVSRYRVDGGPWTEWAAVESVRLSSLGPGKHVVDVEARDHLGSRSGVQSTGSFVIALPLYMQPMFVVPVGLSLIAAAVAVYGFVSRTVQHNKKLAEKEESFRALIEYSSVGITLWDRNRRIFYVSPAVSIILGYEPQELLGEFRADLVHPDDLASTQKRMGNLADTPNVTQRSKLRMKHKNGQYRWIEVISRNLFDNPSVGAIVTNLRDITDSTNAELAAAEARQKAENANQAKSDFLAMISHEIRTPMNGITGMCQLLLESNLNNEQLDYAETIAQSAQSLLALINDVLDFSRIEAGKLTIERAPIDLHMLIQEVAQLMRVRANEKGLVLEISYPEDAPRAFYGDALRIRQILFNLTGNAVKFTHQGYVRIDAKVEYLTGSRYRVGIAVRDSGIGISEDKLPTVFQKFTQADLSTTRRYGGSGLGLSISRSLAGLMGGSIDVTSKLGEGSEFVLELQMDAAPENSLQRRDSSMDALQPLPEPLDILLVEDNKVNQKLALKLLEKLGCSATVAGTGLEALERLSERDYDLILMDCQMPEMDGYEATRRIRERETKTRRVPIIAITANAMEADLEKCLTSGMDSYLTKPIDFIKLRDALEMWGIDYRAPRAAQDPKG